MIIYARSPYFITVAESGQIGSKIEVYIWNKPDSQPASPTYTLSKAIPSVTQIENVYNISPLLLEYLDPVAPTDTTEKMFCKVLVKRYKETSPTVYTLLDSISYNGVNGYTLNRFGYNYTDASNYFILLGEDTIDIQYTRGEYPYINVLVNTVTGHKLDAIYTDLNGANPTTVTYVATGDAATNDVLKIPLTTSSSVYNNGNYLGLGYYVGGVLNLSFTYLVLPICEPKYTPVICSFINRLGGWQFLTFFKAQQSSIQVNKSTYHLMPDALDYNVNRGQSKVFNPNGTQSITLNTGWVPQNYDELIQDLLLTDTCLLDGLPVTVATTASDLKTSLRDKNINYSIDFTYSYALVNNII